jgi:hypothetical protein
MSVAIQEQIESSAVPACLHENPYRLVSLLDLMNIFRASELLRSARDLHNNSSLVFESKRGPEYRLAAIDAFAETIERFQSLTHNQNLPMSALHASQLLESISPTRHMLDIDAAQRMATMLSVTVENELSLRVFLALQHDRKQYFDSPRAGWEQVIERFPDCVSDVEEMNRCFALSRYGASVFHSIQAIEHGLIAVGDWLGVKDPTSGWTAVSNELKRIVGKKYSDRSQFEKDHFEFIEQLQGTVEALKNAWRNKISHATGRIKIGSEFIPEVAEEILMASRSLMRRLATDLPDMQN